MDNKSVSELTESENKTGVDLKSSTTGYQTQYKNIYY